MEESSTPPYKMTIDINVLEHLGINLYSNIAAVLTETVANAWDADAKNVWISINSEAQTENSETQTIEIIDDGVGMSHDDINDKYLRVGYKRRNDLRYGKLTEKNRPVMGRKGLGKLSLFSIAKTIEVQSINEGKRCGFVMNEDDMQKVKPNEYYRPQSLSEDQVKISQGTKITLKRIKRKRLGRGIKALRQRLARRFSIIGESHDFLVYINNEPITIDDRLNLSHIQFLWTVGDFTFTEKQRRHSQKVGELPGNLEVEKEAVQIKGWLGTSYKPSDLNNNDAGNMNGIVVLARGRLFHENILDQINAAGHYTKYLTGQIEADFLDADEKKDIATSDRQRILEDNPRYAALVDFLKTSLNALDKNWSEWRGKDDSQDSSEINESIDAWYKSLRLGFRESAKKMIENIRRLGIEEDSNRKILYKHGILAFERMKLRGSTSEFIASIGDPDKLLQILGEADALEASLYLEITKGRLEAIKAFESFVDENHKERVLQEYLFTHLWLLDPAWDRVEDSVRREKFLKALQAEKDEEKLGRVDITYKTYAGKHIIVELKRAKRKMRVEELIAQGGKYVTLLEKNLPHPKNGTEHNIEVIFVLGQQVEGKPASIKGHMDAIAPGSRIVLYDELINNARNAYQEYLNKYKESDRIAKIIDKLAPDS